MRERRIFRMIYSLIVLVLSLFMVVGWMVTQSKYYEGAVNIEDRILEPARVDKDKADGYWYTLTINELNKNTHCLMFYTNHEEVSVYYRDELLYENLKADSVFGHTTGSVWNIVELPRICTRVMVHVNPALKGIPYVRPVFYYGEGVEIYHAMIVNSLPDIFICIIIISIGMCLMIFYLIIRGSGRKIHDIYHLGMFAFIIGIWSFGETRGAVLLVSNRLMMSYLAHVCLLVVSVPCVYFFYFFLEVGDKFVHRLVILYTMVVFIFINLLQFLNISDMKQNIKWIHSSIFACVFYAVFATIYCLIKHKSRRKLHVNTIGIVILILAMSVDMMSYYSDRLNANRFGKLGFLAYIIMLGVETARTTRKTLDEQRKMKLYQEMAVKDVLTDCYNRNAYNEDIKDESSMRECTIITFDLNNLKFCNDNMGHALGDEYIITAAKIIKQIYEKYGKVYRIGGDEFCVISDKISVHKAGSLLEQLHKLQKRTPFFSKYEHFGIACGYAAYDPELDKELEDTRSRADVLMYKDKKEIKGQSD